MCAFGWIGLTGIFIDDKIQRTTFCLLGYIYRTTNQTRFIITL